MDRGIIKNIFSLFSIQIVNFILPLLFIPYLIRVLGINSFGLYSLILAVVQYLIIVVEYGFNLVSTKEISIHRENREYVSKTFCSVIVCKCLLAFFCFFSLFIYTMISSESHELYVSLYCGFTLVIGNVLLPVWFFQGIERMVVIAISNLAARLLGVPLIFLFVNNSDDLYIAVLIQGVMSIIAGLISLYVIFSQRLVDVVWVSKIDVKSALVSGWKIFISTSFVSLYTTSVPVILGLTSGSHSVGLYSAADKIRQALQGVIGPVSQAMYPRLAKLMNESQQHAFYLIKCMLLYFVVPLFFVSLCIFLLSGFIIEVFYGSEHVIEISELLRVLIWIPPIIGLANILGLQLMLPIGLYRQFSLTYVVSGLVGLPIIYVFSSLYSGLGVSFGLVFIEILVCLLFVYFLHQNSNFFTHKKGNI